MNAGNNGILVLEFGTLRSDKSEHHMLVGTHLNQRLEAARALVVVFEIEHIDILAGEHPIGNRVVGAAVEPCGMVIAATDVCSHNKVGRTAFEGEVIDTEKLIFYEIEIAVEILVAVCCCVAYDGSPCSVVELQIASSDSIELANEVLI